MSTAEKQNRVCCFEVISLLLRYRKTDVVVSQNFQRSSTPVVVLHRPSLTSPYGPDLRPPVLCFMMEQQVKCETVRNDAISHRKLWTALVYRTSLQIFVNLKTSHTHTQIKSKTSDMQFAQQEHVLILYFRTKDRHYTKCWPCMKVLLIFFSLPKHNESMKEEVTWLWGRPLPMILCSS